MTTCHPAGDRIRMETATLDTSGRVECAASFQPIGWAIWSDLDPFTQGYIEALFASMERWPSTIFGDAMYPALPNANGKGHTIGLGFSSLARETLDRIIADCGQVIVRYTQPNHAKTCAHLGRDFWRDRQRKALCATNPDNTPAFPPLTPYLADDGKVHLREAA